MPVREDCTCGVRIPKSWGLKPPCPVHDPIAHAPTPSTEDAIDEFLRLEDAALGVENGPERDALRNFVYKHLSEEQALLDQIKAAVPPPASADARGMELEELLPDHWFACLVNRPASMGGPAECDCNRGKLVALFAASEAAREAQQRVNTASLIEINRLGHEIAFLQEANTGWQSQVTAERQRREQDVAPLVELFRGEEDVWGGKGDDNGWTPVEAAIKLIRYRRAEVTQLRDQIREMSRGPHAG